MNCSSKNNMNWHIGQYIKKPTKTVSVIRWFLEFSGEWFTTVIKNPQDLLQSDIQHWQQETSKIQQE